ncbi:BREX system ATP-binding domain-containing protein [Desulfosporosinus metallidurans]|uniref:Putative ATP /GTP binding protein n=1 Tax=Desulfosporosinus metallidurans TaxID=1888891 RepID=A0A1Q8QNZ9_9FIRM|nr:BREX system ATP-binding domain-containing protein [Desulfosporosinus metallidurans]OLN29073.1 putative ATP /GTP binding protein [Desulfosporosinus metallidurans]
MGNDIHSALARLRKGQAPGNRNILREISVGSDFIMDFWKEKYLANYLALGGSKIKFLTGRTGSGKTHFLELLAMEAENTGYISVCLSARELWIHDFKDIYTAILRQVNLLERLQLCSHEVIRQLGYEPNTIPENFSFADYLSSQGKLDPLTKREIREQLEKQFLSNPLIDNNFALACALLTGGILGHPTLEEASRKLLMLWLEGSREAPLPSLRRLGLSPSKITKYNARHMLRSLVEVCCLAGYKGLVISIDNMEVLVDAEHAETLRYTRLKREDAYESIRELIDEIDTLKHTMFVFSFERSLMDDDTKGLKSYQALWMRIQNEIEGTRFNRFADIVDLDRLIDEVYTPKNILKMSTRLAQVINRLDEGAIPISLSTAEELHAKSRFGKVSLPRRVVLTTLQEGAE